MITDRTLTLKNYRRGWAPPVFSLPTARRSAHASPGSLRQLRSNNLVDAVRPQATGPPVSVSDRESPMLDPIGEFIRQLQGFSGRNWAEQVDLARDIFSSAAATLGVRYFSYHLLQNPRLAAGFSPCSYMITTYPVGWAQRYNADDYVLAEDPVALKVLRSHYPFAWAQIEDEQGTGETHREFLDQAQEGGLGASLTIPIHARREVAMLSVTPRDHDQRVVSRNIHLLNLMANFLHQHVRRAAVEMALTVSSRRPSLLSPRETQVLERAAQGQSTREISAGLGISPKGVDFHIDGAKHKLRASNRTHAVAKAITLGLLSVDI